MIIVKLLMIVVKLLTIIIKLLMIIRANGHFPCAHKHRHEAVVAPRTMARISVHLSSAPQRCQWGAVFLAVT